MKFAVAAILVLLSSGVIASPYDELIEEIKTGQISLSTIAALEQLDSKEHMIGYGLCMAASRSTCITTGSIGYGLCMAASRSTCDPAGSIGYGLCMAASRSTCDPSGSIGYGLCMGGGRSTCAPR